MLIHRVGVDSPRVELEQGNDVLPAKNVGILRAMILALRAAPPGTIIVQEDVELEEADLEMAAAVVSPGMIVCLNPQRSPMHTCPRAFIVSDQETQDRLIELWEREEIQACYSWRPIPKLYPKVRGSHGGTAWQ